MNNEKKLVGCSEKNRAKLNVKTADEYIASIDVDQINSTFAAPFSGMKEMYALQKGIEIGAALGIQWGFRHADETNRKGEV